MKRQALCGAAGLLLSAGAANAVPLHDAALEHAAASIAAQKIGSLEDTLRGTFTGDEEPAFSVPANPAEARPGKLAGKVWIDGLARAVDPMQTVRKVAGDGGTTDGKAGR